MAEPEIALDRRPSTLAVAFAGSVAGVAGLLVGTPFDLIKVRLQNSHQKPTVISVIRNTFKKEGFSAFWKGLTPPLITEALLNQIFFSVYFIASKFIQPDPTRPLTFSQSILVGGLSGFCGSFVVTPTDSIKIRVQVNESIGALKKRPTQIIHEIYSSGGLGGFFRGFWACVTRDIPGVGLYFGFYNFFRQSLLEKDGSISVLNQLASGGFAGTFSWGLVYPLDLIKTRLQSSTEYRGMYHCFSDTLRLEGIRVFFRGFLPCVIRGFPVNAAVFLTYEFVVDLFTKQNTNVN